MSVSLEASRTDRSPVEGAAATVRSIGNWPIAVAALTAIALALRLSQIHQSLVGDEVFSYQDIAGRSFGAVLSTVHTGGENSPPLYFLLAWISAKLGDPTVWLRLPSVVLGTATVPLVYALGRETVGRAAGLIGAAVYALSPFVVYYGIEARPYATMTFFVALSTLALLKALATHSRWWWVLYVAAAAAAAYTHYTCVFLLGVQAAWSLWACRSRIREPLIANVLVALLYVPWLPHLRGKALAVIGVLRPLNAHNVLSDLMQPIPGQPLAPLRAIPTVAGLVAIWACLLVGVVALAHSWWRASRGAGSFRPPPRLGLLVALAAATPVGLLLYSILVTDLWLPRGLSASVPAAALVLGALLARLPRPLMVATVAIVMVTLIAGTIRSLSEPQYVRAPYRAMAAYLDRVARPRDPVMLVSIVGAPAVSAQMHKPHLVLPSIPATPHFAAGSTAYVVLDDTLARAFKILSPRVSGYQLVARRHYAGPFPTDVLTYRPELGAGRTASR